MTQPDLFYPDAPGFRRAGTSRDAAAAVAPTARPLRVQVLSALKDNTGLTVHEVAAYLGKTVAAVQPRFSELLKKGRIADTGRTRPNKSSGLRATVWRAI